MSETADKLAKMKETALAQLTKCGVSNVDNDQLDGYVNSLRTMVNNRDAVLVSGTDPSELETVYRNFVVKKCGVDDKEKGMKAVHAVAEKMKEINQKSRPAFYYMVANELK
jgi:hypothetical protein